MVLKVFVDTDVIIDFLIDRQPHAEASSKIFDLCEKGVLEIYASSLCINNVHYIISKVVGNKKARNVIDELLDLMSILAVSVDDVKSAIKSDFNDFEDAIQHSVALKEKEIKSIITRNIKDYRKSRVAVFTPDSFVKMMKRND